MDFDDLQALLWAHEHGSLQQAAQATGVSRTTLRRRLERLEASLGASVYEPGARGIRLTTAGRTLVEGGPALLASRTRLLQAARGTQGSQTTFRILSQTGHPPWLTAMATSHLASLLHGARIVVDFDVDPHTRIDEDFDAIVHWGESPLPQEGYTRVLMRIPLRLQGSAAYLAVRGTPLKPGDLDQHDILHHAATAPFLPLVGGGELPFSPHHASSDLYVLCCMAAQGMGLALVPSRGIGLHPAVDALVPVLEEQVRGEVVLRLFLPTPSTPDSVAARFIDVLKSIGDELLAKQAEPGSATAG